MNNTTTPNFTLNLLNRKIAFSTLVQYGGKALQLILSSIALKLISNFLSAGGYSYYAAITEFALFLSVIGNLGIFGNLVRLMSDNPSDSRVFSQSLLLRLASALILFLGGLGILLFTERDPVFLVGSVIFLGALLFDYVSSVCDAMLQANYLMGRATLALVIGRIVNTGLLFWLVHNFQAEAAIMDSLSAILACTLLGSLMTAGISLFFVSQKISLGWHWDQPFIWKILKLGLPFGIINIINNLYFRFLPDYFAHQNLGDAAFSSFNINFRIAQVLSLASTFLMFSVLPGLKQYIDEKHLGKAHQLFREITLILVAAGILLVVFGSLLGPTVLTFLTHQKYILDQFWFVLPLMLLLAAISYLYDLVLITLFAFNDEKWFLWQELAALGISLGLFLGSTYTVAETQQIFIILLAAIAAETFVVSRGYLKLKKHFVRESRLLPDSGRREIKKL